MTDGRGTPAPRLGVRPPQDLRPEERRLGVRRGSERRAGPRVVVPVAARVRLDGIDHDGTCVDLSETGLAVRFPRPPSVGAIAHVQLELPSRAPVEGTAEVVRRRSSPGEVGMRFIAIHRASLEALGSFVQASAGRA